MDKILFIHGYSAESEEKTPKAIAGIYGTLPRDLRKIFGGRLVEIDLSRYVSLEDGVTIDDISRALDRALRDEFPDLLRGPLHVIVHSTGALVVRNWIRRFSPKPSPIGNLIYLAGANFGSGWAHIGKGQMAKWARSVFDRGSERGVRVLDGLELGSSWTIDLHLHFLEPGSTMAGDYQIREYVIIGTQADVRWYEIPIRYAKEDGSDGVVRVPASNLNFHYLKFGPTEEARRLDWRKSAGELGKHMDRGRGRGAFYEIKERSIPGEDGRPEIPFAIPCECAHSGDEMGIVTGERPRKQILDLLQRAIGTPRGRWARQVKEFQSVTYAAYERVKAQEPRGNVRRWLEKWIENPRGQYDHHAQIIFRLLDQDGRPVTNYDVFFDSVRGPRDPSLPMRDLFEDKHVNGVSPNVITFYLRTDRFNAVSKVWEARVPEVRGCFLDVSATEPETGEIAYLPMRYEFTPDELVRLIRGHRTTIMDVELLRLPSPEIFRIVEARG